MSRTAVVILNWNTREYLRQFLPPLIASLPENAELIVADNASDDGSLKVLREEFPDVETIALDRNYGFTGGYNRAFGKLDGRFDRYLLMNSDIEVASGWFEPLDSWMDAHPECGACGPKLHSWYDRDRFEYAGAAGGYIDRFGYPFCRGRVLKMVETDNGQYDAPENIMWASGACLMVRADLWRRLGGLDDRFFAHMEEIDLCWRIQLAGYRINTVSESVVWHIGGGTLPNDSPHKLFLNYRNNILLLENNLEQTLALQKDTGARSDAGKRTRKIIRQRRALDIVSAVVYLLQGKMKCFKAVLQAHKEADILVKHRNTPSIVADEAVVYGIYPHWMLPKAIFRKMTATEILRSGEKARRRQG